MSMSFINQSDDLIKSNKILLAGNIGLNLFYETLGKHYFVDELPGYGLWERLLFDEFTETVKRSRLIILLFDNARLFDELIYSGLGIDGFTSLIKQMLQKFNNKKIIINLLDNSTITPISTVNDEISLFALRINSILIEYLENHTNLILFDLNQLIAKIGTIKFYSSKLDILAGVPFSIQGIEEISKMLKLIIDKTTTYDNKKLLIVDLDNTIWGGELVDLGMNNIQIGSNGVGWIYRQVQKIIKHIKLYGGLIAIVSKNYYEDVEEVFSVHNGNLLKIDDFSAIRANFNKKSTNITEISKELNIPLEYIVFVDDSSVERFEVQNTLSDVVVPDFPDNFEDLPDFFQQIFLKYFWSPTLTSEDSKRSIMIAEEQIRQEAKFSQKLDSTAFINSLELKLEIHENVESKTERAFQLINKTNQFNFTRTRIELEEFKNLVTVNNFIVVSVSDRFGNYGDVVVVIYHSDNNEIWIDNMVMSCRVMNRMIEHVVLNHFICSMKSRGANIIKTKYIEWKENQYILGTLISLGFFVESSDGNIHHLTLNLDSYNYNLDIAVSVGVSA